MYYELFWYEDIYKGWGHAGTKAIIKASSKKQAMNIAKSTYGKHVRISCGIRKIDKKEADKLLTPPPLLT